MIDYREQILVMAQVKPLLPGDVAKALSTNLIMASAMLSELADNKKLKISKLKVGSSPLYFLPEKAELLENFVGSLNEKDRKTVEILKNALVLRDCALDPLTRVSLRQISDFSKPVEVLVNNKTELFWKWHLLSDSDAELRIKQILYFEEKKVEAQTLVVEQKPVLQIQTAVKLVADKQMQNSEHFKNSELATVVDVQTNQVVYKQKIPKISKNEFFSKISSFFDGNKIKILEQFQLKISEFDFVIELPSPVGQLTYYCKARNKKKITGADVSAVFVQGQLRKLPSLLLTDGELNKQGKELLQQLKGVSFQKL